VELVKLSAKRIEDENEDDIPARCVCPVQYLQFLTTCCQIKATKGLVVISNAAVLKEDLINLKEGYQENKNRNLIWYRGWAW